MEQKLSEELNTHYLVTPVFSCIKRETNPIFIWGIGALAIDVYKYCKNYGIAVDGCFVNVPTEDLTFNDLPVWTLEDLIKSYPRFSVIIGHSNYAEGMEYLKMIRNVANIYCIPSCCYGVWNIISMDFLAENSHILDRFYSDLDESLSKACLKAYFESRMNDDARYMFPYFEKGIDYYRNDVLTFTANEVLLDVGACKGAAIWPFVEAVKGEYKQIVALEPDDKNYSFLMEIIKSRNTKNILIRKACAFSRNGQVKFSGSGELGGIQPEAETYQIYPAITIDSLCEELGTESTPSIIKINFPFSVPEVLHGAEHLIKSSRPKIIIRAGFDENVLLKTYETIKQINPAYQIYLRYTSGIPQGLTIFAI